MSEKLNKLESLIQEKNPELLNNLLPGLGAREVEELLGDNSVSTPDTLKALWKWKNGQSQSYYGNFHSKTNEMLLSLEDCLEIKEELDECMEAGDISENNWNKQWLPFSENGGGCYMCISLSNGRVYFYDKGEVSTGERFESIDAWVDDLIVGYDAL